MKRLLAPLLVALISITTVSCDECIGMFGKEKVQCNNGGTCNDGECDCLKGYSGPSCDSLDLCELNDVDCVFGLCVNGDCNCQDGYEGQLCEIETREKFLGSYTISEYCDPLDTLVGHTMVIDRDLLDPTRITLSNVFNANQFPIEGFFSKVEARAQKSSMKFTIFGQNPDDNDRSISGSGEIDMADTNNITITIDYTITNGNKTYSCRLDAEKQ